MVSPGFDEGHLRTFVGSDGCEDDKTETLLYCQQPARGVPSPAYAGPKQGGLDFYKLLTNP